MRFVFGELFRWFLYINLIEVLDQFHEWIANGFQEVEMSHCRFGRFSVDWSVKCSQEFFLRKFGVGSSSPGFCVTTVSEKMVEVEDGSIGFTVLHLYGSGIVFEVRQTWFAHSHEQNVSIFFAL